MIWCIKICIVLCITWQAAVSVLSQTAPLSISADPDAVYDGVTDELTVNCTVNPAEVPDFRNLFSIILSKSASGHDDQFTELALISSFEGDKVKVSNNTSGHVVANGSIETSVTSESVLSLKWHNPTGDTVGTYRCEAFWMDTSGHPRTTTTTVDVSEGALNFGMALTRVKQLEAERDECTQYKKNTSFILDQMIGELNNAKAQSANTSSVLKTNIAKVEGLQTFFQDNAQILDFTSRTFGGHAYYLSVKYNNLQLTAADQICRFFKGYLVEIDDQLEFDFLMKYIYDTDHRDYVLTGAIDHGHEDQWTFINSGRDVTFLHWAKDQPNGGSGDNCMFLKWDYSDGGMDDQCCACGVFGRFMCEIPSS